MADGTLSQGGFGSDTAIDLPNSLAVDTQALELITEWRIATSGAEESRWRVYLRRAGATTEAGGFEFPSGGLAMVYIGALTDIVGFRTGHTNLDCLIGGAAPQSWSATATNVHATAIFESDVQFGSQAGVIATNTFQPSIGNYARVPGTPTINGISTGSKTTGYRIMLKVASGTTLVHNSGAPGSGALKLLNVSGANFTTAATRVIPYVLDLIDNVWYQEG